MKSKTTSKTSSDIGDLDPSEATEKYDEFNAIMLPVSTRTLSKSPTNDEGIEPDNESSKTINRCWSLDSSANGDDEGVRTGLCQRRRSKFKVTRCCSSDSAVISDDDQNKGWDNLILGDKSECDSIDDKPRYWRTPSVVVSDYSDYSYLEEKFERCDLDAEKYDGTSGSPSQASSCSCLDCDEIRDFHDLSSSIDNRHLQVCGQRRHSDSCCACLSSQNTINSGISNNQNRRNSCLTTSSSYSFKLDLPRLKISNCDVCEETKTTVELLDIPPIRKISDCSTNSSLSGDDFEVTELRPLRRPTQV